MGGNDDHTLDSPLPQEGAAGRARETPDPRLAALGERFELLGELGRGGMGVVYKALDRETDEIVALKLLHPEIASRPDVIERFKAEVRLARKITHKNVCRIYDLNRFGDVAAISMEYVEGESLRRLLNRVEGFSIRQGLKIARQICAALGEAHSQGVVHRDIKPENILIARDGTVKVMDFGIARLVEADATATATLSGTPAYMSPEQAEGKAAGPASDIYSLGLVMYEIFTGTPAFRADTPVAAALKQVRETPRSPREIEPDVPERIERAILRCLEKEPKKRFSSVAEAAGALEPQAAAPLTADGEPQPPPGLTLWHGFDWALLALGVAGLIYFLAARDYVFPASLLRLEVDVIAARRAAEQLGTRLGRPFPARKPEMQLEFRRGLYQSSVEAQFFRRRNTNEVWPDTVGGMPWKPLAWHLRYTGMAKYFAIVDARGRVERLHAPHWVPGRYDPAPVERRRAIATEAAEAACGPLPANPVLKETSGGEAGASYTVGWHRRRGPLGRPVAEVNLLAEQVVDIGCGDQEPVFLPPTSQVLWFTGSLAGSLLVILFVLGRCYRLAAIWKRLPLAVVLGLIGSWLVSLGGGQASEAGGADSTPSLGLLLVGAFTGTAMALIALATAEHYLRRRAPQWVSSYVLLWRGRIREPAVMMAIVRGALAGLALVALETLFAHGTLIFSSRYGLLSAGRLRLISIFTTAFVDPLPVARAVWSSSPALYAAAAPIFDAVVIGVILLGLPGALFVRRRMSGLTVALVWLASGFHLHLAEFVFPPFGIFFAWVLEGVLLGWLIRRYDVLTVVVTVGTAVLWIVNYPLLVLFAEVGNGPHWLIFCAWAALVVFAAATAFRSSVARARRRVLAALQQ